MVTLVLVLLMVSSVFVVFLSSSVPAVNAAPYIAEGRVDPVTGEPYGDILQYDWIGDGSTWSGGDAPEMTKYNAGPAPGRPDIAWELGARDDIGTVSGWGKEEPAFVGGLILISSTKAGSNYINALDPITGDLVWQIPKTSGDPEVIDDTHFKVNEEDGAGEDIWMVFNIADGTFAYNTTSGVPTGGNWLLEDQVLFSTQTYGSGADAIWRVVGWDISDPIHGVPVIWNVSANFGANPSQLCAGDGKIFYSSWGDYYIVAINSKTGIIEWNVMGKTNLRDAIYYDGKLITSGVGTRLTAYDGETGELIWDYNAGVRGYFANTGCAAYGLLFQHCMDIPYGYFGAWDADTGELVWKIPAWYYIGYFSPVVADGKVYVPLSDGRGVSQSLGVEDVHTACVDAFTGEVIWAAPGLMGFSGFGGFHKIAYGALWLRGPDDPRPIQCVSDVIPAKDWGQWRGNTEQSGVAVGQSGPSDINNYLWKYETEGPITGSAVAADGKVYFGSQDKNIYCLNARNGSLIWKFPTDYKVRSTPAVVDGKLYTGADDGSIYCINANTGSQIWNEDIDGTYNGDLEYRFSGQWMLRSSPIIVGNRLYVGALDGKLYCLNTATGSVVWTYQTGYPIGGSVAYHDGVIYIGSVDMFLYALNAANGDLIWSTQVASSIVSYTGTGLYGTPLVVPSEGRIYIQSSGGTSPMLHALHIMNGSRCTFANGTDMIMPLLGSTPASSTPVYFKGLIYTVGYWRTQCWNATSGIRLWQVYMGHQTFSSPAIADGADFPKLYVGDEVGAVHCIDIKNVSQGVPLSVYATSGTVPGSPAIYERKLYLGWVDWNMYCFGDAVVEDTHITCSLSASTIATGASVTVSGRLIKPQTNIFTGELFTPGLPNMPVLVSFGKDSDRHDVSATTDMKGQFTVTYTPTAAGEYSVMSWFEGEDLVTYSYNYAYSSEQSLTVGASASSAIGNNIVELAEGIPMEYVYAAVAIVAIAIIASAGYLYLKKAKK